MKCLDTKVLSDLKLCTLVPLIPKMLNPQTGFARTAKKVISRFRYGLHIQVLWRVTTYIVSSRDLEIMF